MMKGEHQMIHYIITLVLAYCGLASHFVSATLALGDHFVQLSFAFTPAKLHACVYFLIYLSVHFRPVFVLLSVVFLAANVHYG